MPSKRGWYQLALQHAPRLKNQGLKPAIRLVNESFEFGGGEVLTATRAFIYPAIINDHLVEVNIAEVPGSCPPLLSRQP